MTATTAPTYRLDLDIDRLDAYSPDGALLVGARRHASGWKIFFPWPISHHVHAPTKAVATKHVELIAQLMTGVSK